jgi:hypothetical protein
MGLLRVISKGEDERLNWNEQNALAGERAMGATAYRVKAGKSVERLEQFDPQASQIIMVPQVAGG